MITVTLEEWIQQKLDLVEEKGKKGVAVDSVRAWIEHYNEHKQQGVPMYDMYEELKKHFEVTPMEQIQKAWDETEKYDSVGPVFESEPTSAGRIYTSVFIPTNDVIDEQDFYASKNDIVNLLMKYKNRPDAIQFIAEMLEE